jgi:geranylgeranyl diphosphate synthase type I
MLTSLGPKDLTLSSFQKAFNPHLKKFLKAKVYSRRELPHSGLATDTINHATRIINEGGKRIRPYLCFLTYKEEGGKDSAYALHNSIALELLHAFALIHDDIIDKGVERHGKPTIHTHITSVIANTNVQDSAHIGESMALLAGDLVFSWSHEIIMGSKNNEAITLFFKMIEEVVIGQMLDVLITIQSRVTIKDIEQKNNLKTARYSFVNPMLIGAALAHSKRHVPFYTKLGVMLGQAFQMQDDLLDITGGKATGKKTFVDIEDRQHTLLTQYVFDHGSPAKKEILEKSLGKKLAKKDRAMLLELFHSTGAITYAEKNIAALFKKSQAMIDASDLKNKDAWHGMVSLLTKRIS